MTAADGYQEIPITFQFNTAANSSGDIIIPARNSLTIVCYSAGLSGAGTSQLVFNADTASQYNTTYISMPSGSTTPTNTANASAAAVIFTPSQTTAFLAVFKVSSFGTNTKVFTYRITYIDGTNAPVVAFGGGEYVGGNFFITKVRMTASANNYAVGSGMWIYGGDAL